MNKLSRKEFLRLSKSIFTFIGLGAIAGPVIAYFYPTELEEIPSEPMPACSEDELPLGKSTTVQFGRYPAIVVHTEEGIRAYSAVCTHFACITQWHEELGQIVCPCHEGYFNPIDGSVISGPPPEPLQQYEVRNIDGTLFISAGDNL